MEEFVFAIPAEELWKITAYQEKGLIKGNTAALKKIVKKGQFHSRDVIEENPSFKQLITYAIISNKESWYLFQRTSGQREKRLHNKFTLGAGGHMNPETTAPMNTQYLTNELMRELEEEIAMSDDCQIEKMEFIGFINDDTIPVGRCHIGLLYDIRVTNRNIVIKETDRMTAQWTGRRGLSDLYEGLETWSQVVFDSFIK